MNGLFSVVSRAYSIFSQNCYKQGPYAGLFLGGGGDSRPPLPGSRVREGSHGPTSPHLRFALAPCSFPAMVGEEGNSRLIAGLWWGRRVCDPFSPVTPPSSPTAIPLPQLAHSPGFSWLAQDCIAWACHSGFPPTSQLT